MDRHHAAKMLAELSASGIAGWYPKKLLGNGKSAAVFRAENGSNTAALKVFDRELVEQYGKTEQLERISREKSLVGKTHPNLIQILDAGYSDSQDLMYVVMEYLPWQNMYESLQVIPRDSIRPLIAQIADATKYLEDLGIAHRDIKPDNILVSPDFRRACLLDLGVIRPIDAEGVTDDDFFVGTHQYSPPEFILRKEDQTPAGYRAITFYQLGAVLHDLIMRRRIFSDYQRPAAVLSNAIQQMRPEIDATDVDPFLVALALKCLQKRPEQRLNHVDWTDFAPVPPVLENPVAAKERVKRRRAAYQKSPAVAEEPVNAEDRKQEALEAAAKLVHTLARAIHSSNSTDFPALAAPDPEIRGPSAAWIRLGWGRAPSKGLGTDVTVIVNLSIDDPLLLTGSCQGAVWIGSTPPDSLSALEGRSKEIFKGVFRKELLTEALEAMLFSALDRAQAYFEIKGPKFQDEWLEVS